MPKPKKFTYEKKPPSRDAFFFIIICEGENREPDYFRFFDGISSRVKVVPVASEAGISAPVRLIDNARAKEDELDVDEDIDQVWFVIDTDRWRNQTHELREEARHHVHWQVVQSNPCFEVWLYFHFMSALPVLDHIDQCNNWKPHVGAIVAGGFNSDIHPIFIETASANAKVNFQGDGYTPRPGSTQVWRLADELIPLIKKELDLLIPKFPVPVIAV